MVRWPRDISLEMRFLVFSLVVLLGGALIIGTWVSRAISTGVLNRSAATSALYAESFVGPLIDGQSFEGPLDAGTVERLDALFISSQFAEQVVSVKLWAPDGTVRYARDPGLTGAHFTVSGGLARAVDGHVESRISGLGGAENEFEARTWSRLIETYVPIWSPEENAVVAVAEFYELPDELESELATARLTGWTIVGSATLVMFLLLNGMMRAASRTIRDQNVTLQQLRGLHEATLTLSGQVRLESALQEAVTLCVGLIGTRYGALASVDGEGKIVEFLTSGIDDETRIRIGRLPSGEGLLGEPIRSGARVRVNDIGSQPNGLGLPPHHPEIVRLLGVPLVHGGIVRGALYLADRLDGRPFTAVDEEIAGMFATHAAVVAQNARLHSDIESLAIERERQHIAREMHDGLAQVLGFVNTKAQAVEQFLRNGDVASAERHLAELSEAARRVYADVREGIVALRLQSGGGRSLRQVLDEYVAEFRHFARVEVDVAWELDDDILQVSQVVEVQLMRVIQEALTNVRRHARARAATVTLRSTDSMLELTIRDDGEGFDPARVTRGPWPQFGLRAMRERAESVGGTIEVQSRPGSGTTVHVRFPNALEKRGPLRR